MSRLPLQQHQHQVIEEVKMLTTKRPTQTTVLYTVSTRGQDQTIAARASSYGLLLLRLLAGLFVLTILVHEALPFVPNSQLISLGAALWIAPFRVLEQHSTPLYRLLISTGVAFLVLRKNYVEESLLVIRGLGVQTSTSSPSYLWTSSTRFIPTCAIQDIFIHEAFKGFEVRYYLGIVVEGEEGVVVVFPNILPRREILEEVWRGARACLYEPKT